MNCDVVMMIYENKFPNLYIEHYLKGKRPHTFLLAIMKSGTENNCRPMCDEQLYHDNDI